MQARSKREVTIRVGPDDSIHAYCGYGTIVGPLDIVLAQARTWLADIDLKGEDCERATGNEPGAFAGSSSADWNPPAPRGSGGCLYRHRPCGCRAYPVARQGRYVMECGTCQRGILAWELEAVPAVPVEEDGMRLEAEPGVSERALAVITVGVVLGIVLAGLALGWFG